MAERIVAVYSNHRHSCFLYLTSILVDEIGDNYSLDLQNLFRMLAEPTLELLNQHDGLRKVISTFFFTNYFFCSKIEISKDKIPIQSMIGVDWLLAWDKRHVIIFILKKFFPWFLNQQLLPLDLIIGTHQHQFINF